MASALAICRYTLAAIYHKAPKPAIAWPTPISWPHIGSMSLYTPFNVP